MENTKNIKKKLVDVWFIKNIFYVQAYSKDTNGLWNSATCPTYAVSIQDKDALGKAALQALLDSKIGVPVLDLAECAAINKKRLTSMGVKSEKELMKNGKCIDIEQKDEDLTVAIIEFDGKHMQPSSKPKISTSFEPEILTRDILKAFEIGE
jgi:hypothetical protein